MRDRLSRSGAPPSRRTIASAPNRFGCEERSLRVGSETAKYPRGPYVLRFPEAELHVDPDVGYEAFSVVEVSLIAKTHDATCHEADGFREFYADFVRALASGNRRDVLAFFRFPFKDEVAAASYSKPATFDAKSFPFEKFFDRAAGRWPAGAHCELRLGYIDDEWLPGQVVATHGDDGWRWTYSMYVP